MCSVVLDSTGTDHHHPTAATAAAASNLHRSSRRRRRQASRGRSPRSARASTDVSSGTMRRTHLDSVGVWSSRRAPLHAARGGAWCSERLALVPTMKSSSGSTTPQSHGLATHHAPGCLHHPFVVGQAPPNKRSTTLPTTTTAANSAHPCPPMPITPDHRRPTQL